MRKLQKYRSARFLKREKSGAAIAANNFFKSINQNNNTQKSLDLSNEASRSLNNMIKTQSIQKCLGLRKIIISPGQKQPTPTIFQTSSKESNPLFSKTEENSEVTQLPEKKIKVLHKRDKIKNNKKILKEYMQKKLGLPYLSQIIETEANKVVVPRSAKKTQE